MEIARTALDKESAGLLRRHPVVGLLGARQVGKTTLARKLARRVRGGSIIYDFENPDDLERLSEPLAELRRHEGLVVADEVQRRRKAAAVGGWRGTSAGLVALRSSICEVRRLGAPASPQPEADPC